MKIIAKADDNRYMVEVKHYELLMIAGCESDAAFARLHPSSREQSTGHVRIGVNIDVHEQWRWLTELRRHEQRIKDSAVILRAIANMVDKALPSALTAPPEPPQPLIEQT